jgi:hypothetical protein
MPLALVLALRDHRFYVMDTQPLSYLRKAVVDSTGERNSGGQCISWGAVSECLAGSAVEF